MAKFEIGENVRVRENGFFAPGRVGTVYTFDEEDSVWPVIVTIDGEMVAFREDELDKYDDGTYEIWITRVGHEDQPTVIEGIVEHWLEGDFLSLEVPTGDEEVPRQVGVNLNKILSYEVIYG